MLDADEARRLYVSVLSDKVRRDRFPSQNHMDRIEAALTPDTASDYLELLLDKIAEENYPSPTMLARIENVAAQLPRRAPVRRAPARSRRDDDRDDEE